MYPKRIALTLLAVAATALLTASAASASVPAVTPGMPTHQWKMPVRGTQPKGVVIAIHGGGWLEGDLLATENSDVLRYRQQGWATLNIDYRSGVDSIKDVAAFYDIARKTYPDLPICSSGQSAGGNLAMLLAVERPGLACAMSQQGPVSLVPLMQGRTVRGLLDTMDQLFTMQDAVRFSPAIRLPKTYKGQILATYSLADKIIPGADQLRAMRRMPSVRVFRVHGMDAQHGNVARTGMQGGFPHIDVSTRDITAYHTAERDLLRSVAS